MRMIHYYVNPSGNSVFSGKITTNYNVQESDSSNTVANKEYVDLKMGSVVTEDAIAAKLYYVKGASNPSCPTGTNEVGRHWVAKTCSLSGGWTVYFSGGWYGVNDTPTESTDYRSCSPDYYDAVMCAGPDPANMLFELTHTLNDCTAIGGTVVTVEDSVKICKVPHTSLSGNCRNNNCYPCQHGSCQDTCSCPTGWKSYKSWMTTAGRCIGSYCYFNIPGHAWANEGRAMVWDGECDGWYADVDYKACY